VGTKQFSNYESLLTFTRASKGHALRPVSYGTELVTNGTFDSDTTGWTNAPSYLLDTFELDAGRLHIENTAGTTQAAYTDDNISLVAGKIYRFTAELEKAGGSDNWEIDIRTQGAGTTRYSLTTTATTETLQVIFVATQTENTAIQITTRNTFEGYIDNVSVKEVTFDESDGTLTLFEHPDNVPRVEYDADGNRLGLLVEEARTNLVTYSEDISQYAKVNSPTITTDIATAPDGTETVDGIQDASGGAFRRAKMFEGSVTANSTHTGSLFVKKETSETNYGGITLNFTGGTSKVCYGIIDAVNGTITAPSSGNTITPTFTTTEVGDFWRFSITATDTGSNTQLEFGVYGTLSTNGTTVGSGAGSVRRIWGAQLEAGSFPTSYIKSNSGSTTTRSADLASIPVADFGYNQSAGTLLVDYLYQSLGSGELGRYLELGGSNPSQDRILLYLSESSENTALQIRTTAGGTQTGLNVSTPIGQFNKVAGGFSKDDVAAVSNGGSAVTDTSADIPANIVELDIGASSSNIADVGVVYIKSIQYYPRRLSNAQLVELTS